MILLRDVLVGCVGKADGRSRNAEGQWSGERVRKVFLKNFKLEVTEHN